MNFTPALAINQRHELLKTLTYQPDVVAFGSARLHQQALRYLIKNISEAQIHIWKDRIFSAAIRGHEVFMGELPGRYDLTPSTEIHFIGGDFVVRNLPDMIIGIQGEWQLHCVVIKKYTDFGIRGLHCTFVCLRKGAGLAGDKRICIFGNFVEEGVMCPPSLTVIFAMNRFMHSKIITLDEVNSNHRQRKDNRNRGVTDTNPVRVISLRRRERPTHENSGDATSVDWSCQWLVSGHWRKLHQPRKWDGEQFVYIQPYVKGPEDKPLRVSKPIYSVNR